MLLFVSLLLTKHPPLKLLSESIQIHTSDFFSLADWLFPLKQRISSQMSPSKSQVRTSKSVHLFLYASVHAEVKHQIYILLCIIHSYQL